MDIYNDKRFNRINNDIAECKFYDSLQHIISFVKRNISYNKYHECIDVLYKYSMIFIDRNEYVLAGELMDEFVKILEEGSIPCNEDIIKKIITIFESPWQYHDKKMKLITMGGVKKLNSTNIEDLAMIMSLYLKFMNRAIVWSKSKDYPYGNNLLHKSIGLYYMNDGQYSKAQSYLIYSQDIEVLFSLINEWKDYGRDNEVELFYLRAVLMLLSCKDVCNAKCLICLLDYDLDDPQIPIPIQFANLISECCDPPDYDLFKDICDVYKPVISIDPEYKVLLKRIEDSFFIHLNNLNTYDTSNIDRSLKFLMQSIF